MLETIRFIIIILISIFSLITIYVLYKSIKYARKSRRLFKSSYNSTFKNTFSTILIIIFFGVSFSVVAGTIESTQRIEKSLDELFIENNLHFSYMDLNNIEEYGDPVFNFDGDDEIDDFLESYFNFNPAIADFFGLFYIYKTLSVYLEDDSMKNILWKYELSYYMTTETSTWGYQYIALNNYDISQMIIDKVRGDPKSLDEYLLTDYKNNTLTQQTITPTNNENLLVDDYQVIDSYSDAGVNDLFLDDNLAESTDDYDVKVGVGYEWAKANNVDIGDVISLPQPFGTNIKAKVVLTFRVPHYAFPSFSTTKPIPDTKEQTYVLMNTNSFLNYFGPTAKAYVFFGFDNLYNDVSTYSDYVSNFIRVRINDYNLKINKLSLTFFINANAKRFNNLSDYTSIRVETVFAQIRVMKLLTKVFIIFFLTIIIFILIVLMKKKINQSASEIGTLKAIGWTPDKIAVSFIAFPIMIIIIGGIIAMCLSGLIQLLWMGIWRRQFLISSGTFILPPISFIIVFLLPIVFLFVISYFITIRMLKKPTLDLINDVDEYKPNILIRGSGKVTNNFKYFMNSYRVKTLLRGVGKSTILFTSTLFSILIITFGLSGMNIVNDTTELINESMQFDTMFIIENKNVDVIEESEIPSSVDDYFFVELSDSQEESLLSIENDENADEKINEFFNNEIKDEIVGNSKEERANSFDNLFGEYIKTTSFYEDNMMIPWQSFELLNVALEYVQEGEGDFDLSVPLSNTGLTIEQYQNIYTQYIKYYNYNDALKTSNNETTIKPNVTMNKIIYDEDNETEYNATTANWNEYIDSITGDTVTNVDDLKEHKLQYDGKIYTREDYTNGRYGEEYVYEFYQNDNLINVSGKPTVNDYIEQLNNSLSLNQEIRLNSDDITDWEVIKDEDDNILYRTRTYGLNKYEQSVAEINDEYFVQWISIINNYDDISKIIKFNDEYSLPLDNYEPQNVEVVDSINGDTSSIKTIPIIIDEINAKRLDINEGDILKTDFIDQDNQDLYNYLKLSGINGSVAFEVVNVFPSHIPYGAFTLWEYIDNYSSSSLRTSSIFQKDAKQKNSYSFTSYNYQDGSTLLESFKYDFHGNYDAIISRQVIEDQINFIASIIIIIFFVFAFFAAFIAISLISISIKEIANDSGKEISILKAVGYSNKQATSLIIAPYLLIMLVSFLIVIPINILFFVFLSNLINSYLGAVSVRLGVTFIQWMLIILFIIIFFIILIYIVYRTFKNRNPIEVINRE